MCYKARIFTQGCHYLLTRPETICTIGSFLVREERMCKVHGKTYRSSDCVVVRTGPIPVFESLRSSKCRTYMQGCVIVIVWRGPTLQEEPQRSYVAQSASSTMGTGISQRLNMNFIRHKAPMLDIHAAPPTIFLSLYAHALTLHNFILTCKFLQYNRFKHSKTQDVTTISYFFCAYKLMINKIRISCTNIYLCSAIVHKIKVKLVHPVVCMMKTIIRFISPSNTTYVVICILITK
jgi:hypothetical protein